MPILAHLLLAALAVPAVLACLYLLVLTLLSARLPPPPPSLRRVRFDIVVPAHDEAEVIERTVRSLLQLDWPRDAFRVLVIADNCSDATASLARACGAAVLERHDTSRRGKGYALEFAFEHCRRDGFAQALVVVDADSEVSANLLEALATRLERGAQALQVHYGVLNPLVSWRTRLMTIAMTAFHLVRSRARERLGVSCGIRGNGWCVTRALLGTVPYRAYSLTEDIEFGIALALAGQRVAYCDEAQVRGEMVSRAAAAGKQRQRWEHGRFALLRSSALPLLARALTRGDRVCLDLALDLLVLPLSYVALAVLVLLAGGAALTWWHPAEAPWLWLAVATAAALWLHILRGWQLSGIGWRGLLDLACVPLFVLWKLRILLGRRSPDAWVRTEREGP
ncbi:MAG TPA: glycosyltransferase family 2 protein [Steroidobacteraceae bacterium]|nr:glycosyltransferase family 2 protein [Steroidobacteraceae bacterium]